jgi:hypothetical protein
MIRDFRWAVGYLPHSDVLRSKPLPRVAEPEHMTGTAG